MDIIPLMAVLALALASGFVLACLWALSNGQYDDMTTPSFRILKEDQNKNHESERNMHHE